MAGMVTRLNLQADHPGTFRGISANYSGAGFSDMHFDVDAVPPEQFAEWVKTVRNSGPVLDAQSYADLVKPSEAVAPFTYRAVSPGLFGRIATAEAPTDDPSLCVPSASLRAER
jgi:cytochrome o ubiquinol oxidase subunit 2